MSNIGTFSQNLKFFEPFDNASWPTNSLGQTETNEAIAGNSAPSLAPELNDLPLGRYGPRASVKTATVMRPPGAPTATESDTAKFLRCVLPPAGPYGLACLNEQKTMHRKFVMTIDELAREALTISAQHKDAYFATCSFKDGGEMARQDGSNVAASRCLHLDLDCGADKAEKGEGYATVNEARAALTQFVEATGLPQPLVVCSGYGLHVYWPLVGALSKSEWLRNGIGLKALAKEHGLLADPSVTADVARILRVPGSKNYKHGQVADVTFDRGQLALGPYDFSEFICLLDHAQPTPSAPIDLAGGKPQQSTASTVYNEDTLAYYGSALMAIPVADDRPTWLRVGMAMHALGWDEAGYKLWVDWSRKSSKFDEEDQRKTWESFDREREEGAESVGVGTLLKMAEDNEWKPKPLLEKRMRAMKAAAMNGAVAERIAETNKTFFVIRDDGGKCVVGHFAENEFGGRTLKKQNWYDWTASRTNDLILNPLTGKLVPYGKFWMDHPDRLTYSGTDFRPGEPEILEGNVLNLYRGWGVEPRPGDWGLMRGRRRGSGKVYLRLRSMVSPESSEERDGCPCFQR